MKNFMIAALLLSGFAGLYCPEEPQKKKVSREKKVKQQQRASEWWKIASSLGAPWMPYFVKSAKRRK